MNIHHVQNYPDNIYLQSVFLCLLIFSLRQTVRNLISEGFIQCSVAAEQNHMGIRCKKVQVTVRVFRGLHKDC